MSGHRNRWLIPGLIIVTALSLSAAPATAKQFRTATKITKASVHGVSGKVKRANKRGRTRVVIRRLRSGSVVRRSISRLRGGRFSATVGALPPGDYVATARYLGSRRTKPSRSQPKTFSVTTTCDLPSVATTGLGDLSLDECEGGKQDNGSSTDPESLWGNVECQNDSRAKVIGSGGDTHATATGGGANGAFRRLRVIDGDDFYGERCELGRNEHRFGSSGGDGTFRVYREGERWVSFVSLRLPPSFQLSSSTWKTVIQMKQAQPSANGGGAPVLEVQTYQGRWWLINSWDEVWSVPAQKGVWTRFALDVTYSRNDGSIRMNVDANGDGDATDSGETSPVFNLKTLKQEIAGGWSGDGIAAGQSIPSHLRTGLYHDPSISCPPPLGCSIDVDNVETIRAR